MLSLKNKLLMSAMAIGLLSASGFMATAQAQTGYGQSGQPQQQQHQMQQTEVTDQQLQEFVAAQEAVGEIQEQFQGQAQGIESQADLQALQEQASQQMIQAVERTDLTLQEYNLIAQMVQSDPQLQQRYSELAR